MQTIIEPFRIKVIEPLKTLSKEERIAALKAAHYNVFLLDAEDSSIDLLTDSGTGAMSAQQWAVMMLGDESYAGSKSWKKFEARVREITTMKHIFPVHQGRAAEGILTTTRVGKEDVIPNNSHFDTTRANIEFMGAIALNLLCREGLEPGRLAPFKGNVDIHKLRRCIHEHGSEKIPFGMITITNNSGGGQPVSMANIRTVSNLLHDSGIPLVIDACRFAENAYFIKQREAGYEYSSLLEIAQEMFSYADAVTMSCKKDGLANIGGFLACQNDDWAQDFKNALILREGFPTYGGLAGRDLEAIAVGLSEVLDLEYQTYRHATVEYLSRKLIEMDIPIVQPVGGHAVFINSKEFLPHIPALQYPGIGLVNSLFVEGGVRAVEIGSVMFGVVDAVGNETTADLELVRLAFPRRVYTQSHFDYLIEVIDEVWQRRRSVSGYRIVRQPKLLRHFSCHFEPLQ